jgi:hypothetical protein
MKLSTYIALSLFISVNVWAPKKNAVHKRDKIQLILRPNCYNNLRYSTIATAQRVLGTDAVIRELFEIPRHATWQEVRNIIFAKHQPFNGNVRI